MISLSRGDEMTYHNPQVPWTDEQWARVNQVIQEEAQRARVAASFLPLYGPLSESADFVRSNKISYKPLKIADRNTLKLQTLQIKVRVRGAQLADPEMTSVLALFRRAANVLARLEDALIFNGWTKGQELPALAPDVGEQLLSYANSPGLSDAPRQTPLSPATGDALVTAVTGSIGDLEARGHFGPFAVVLSQALFQLAQTPSAAIPQVLPRDRILPFLGGGTLLRSSTLPDERGLVVALGGAPIDLVVGTDMSLQFLQVTREANFLFRVYEKLVLRIKEEDAIVALRA
jgi:uncharacterized linocin/CFP29 family protein